MDTQQPESDGECETGGPVRRDWSGARVLVFHAGALGDFVLIWPLLRALQRGGAGVVSVCASSHAALVRRAIPIDSISSERAWVTGLWRETGGASVVRADDASGVPRADVVVSFVADEASEAGRRWLRNARAATGAAEVHIGGAPGSESRNSMWRITAVAEFGGVEVCENGSGPIVLYTGAGSREKMWPMTRWGELAERVRCAGLPVEVLAGPVERERFGAHESRLFEAAGGRWIDELSALHDACAGARVFVGADTGPTHLAAQLGVATVALFGPTDPAVWRPAGPSVRLVRAAQPILEALDADRVWSEVSKMLGGPNCRRDR